MFTTFSGFIGFAAPGAQRGDNAAYYNKLPDFTGFSRADYQLFGAHQVRCRGCALPSGAVSNAPSLALNGLL